MQIPGTPVRPTQHTRANNEKNVHKPVNQSLNYSNQFGAKIDCSFFKYIFMLKHSRY